MLSSAIAVFPGSLIEALIVKTKSGHPEGARPRGFEFRREPQGHVVEQAYLRRREARADLALDRLWRRSRVTQRPWPRYQ